MKGGCLKLFKRKKLAQSINEKRQEMIKIAIEKGFTSKEAITCSQELDHLLNLYRKVSLQVAS